MQRIVVPTDFSDCAEEALVTAALIAEKCNAEIVLVHAYGDLEAGYVEERKAHLGKLADRFKQEIPRITTAFLQGSLQDTLPAFLSETKTDFVCMGSHGSSGLHEMFIGSNAQKMIRILGTPLLIVKNSLASTRFNHVVFASDFDLEEQQAFRFFVRFLRDTGNTDTTIHLLNINTGSFFSNPSIIVESAMQSFRKLAGEFPTSLHFYSDFTIEKGIEKFTEKTQAELIAVKNSRRSRLHRIIFGSHIEALVNLSHSPVLAI